MQTPAPHQRYAPPARTTWLRRWPTVEALAAAPRSDVIRAWEGLGYNRRAVNLHRAAIEIAHHGWPDELTELPGVGPYTADAVASLAFGRPVLPVDVNVRRVLERSGLEFAPACGPALMGLGAPVCSARVPRCGVCRLADVCPPRGVRCVPVRNQAPYYGSFPQRRAATHHHHGERSPSRCLGKTAGAIASLITFRGQPVDGRGIILSGAN